MLSWPSTWHVGIPVTNPELVGKRLSWHIKNLDTSQSHLDCRDYSCHQGLLSTWHGINHMMRLMEWWCILLKAKHRNTLTVCILTFQLNQETCVLGYVQTDLTHSGHLLLLILVGRSYSRFITCHPYEVGFHVFIHYHTRSEQPGPEYRCLSSTIDWWVEQLWSSEALTYDILRKENFVMRAALMWTINDFPAYGMVSGLSTHGKLAYPYCMEN